MEKELLNLCFKYVKETRKKTPTTQPSYIDFHSFINWLAAREYDKDTDTNDN